MTRRTATLFVSSFLLVVLAVVAAMLPVPYVEFSPGPTFNTLGSVNGKPLIEIEGRQTYPAKGRLDLTTVGVTRSDERISLFQALRGWLDPDEAIVPRQTVYPDDASDQQIQQRNAEEMQNSQEHATVAALRELKIPVTETVVVSSVVKDAPALGKLHAGDEIVAIDGKAVRNPEEVRAAVSRHRPGETVRFRVEREGKRVDVSVPTKADPGDGERAIVGIVVGEGHDYPFEVKIQLDDVGGPSAGLMFALGIVDKLTPGELTGGQFIAGTGEIDDEGRVGPIGGIQMKIIAAQKAGATAFLVPAQNCDEALGIEPEIKLVKVETLHGAVQALEALRTGKGDVPSCAR
ncbi:PDZ/DHR/GLGF domain-containing protein [Carbonactinospora thermoautotrophica]|uniref:YlbL family protein n=1 Tax=Carbonactinospora thermoautotrophica TaxID=1469144 RepID=UPI00226F809D|nr:PDZ domain-containing protein [Carbonactinospora thermoautotrophica]MCX9192519.1 PDZ/DHR/GLGF domain-containing protein [Carbonactinospora thermoautotrophica]